MIKKCKYILFAYAFFALASCNTEEYALGELVPPTNVVLSAEIVGQTDATPNGDGTGNVNFKITADNALSYRIDYDAADALNLVNLPKGTASNKYTRLGINTYVVTAVVYGAGGTSSTVTKEITVVSNFIPDATLVNNLTAGTSKTWKVDQSVAGHFGVGPWSGSVTPEWWKAGVDEKVNCCNCFYTATFKFTKTATGYTIDVNSPDGVFTKTGNLAGGLPGIPSSGDEGCYPYPGGSNSFALAPSSTGLPANTPSTQTTIKLSGNNTFIGYGALLKEFEILEITPTYLYLRAQGTETGNAWYLKMKAL